MALGAAKRWFESNRPGHSASRLDLAARRTLSSSTVESVEEVVRDIVRAAQRALRVQRVILFGSRAREDARPDSDIDLAFEHGSTDAEWAAFVNEMADRAPTLLAVDLIDLPRAEPGLRERICREGRLVHG